MKKALLISVVLLGSFCFKSEAQLLKKIKDNLTKKSGGSNEQSSQQQSNANDKKFASKDYGHVQYKLEDGEKLMNGEECVFFNGSFEQFQFITKKKDGKYYFHNHDRVSGPFDKPPMDSLKDCMDKQPNEGKRKSTDGQALLAKYQTINNAATTPFGLKIGNKSYGPYNMITNLYVSADESRFYATVMMLGSNEKDVDYYLVSNNNKVKLPAIPGGWIISPSGNQCAIPMAQSQMNGNSDPTAVDLNGPVTLIFHDGHKKGPIPEYYVHPNGMLTNGGYYVQFKYTERQTVYVDGKPTLKFSKDVNTNTLLLNDNATSGAFFDFGDLYFSDGTAIEREAIRPHVVKQNGKTYVRWMAVDNEGNIYECSKEI